MFLFCLNYFIIAEAYSQVSIASTPCSRKMYSPKISQSVSFKERSHSMWLLSQSSLVAFFFPSKSPPSLTPYSPHGLSDLTACASPPPLLHPTLASCWFVDMPHMTSPTQVPGPPVSLAGNSLLLNTFLTVPFTPLDLYSNVSLADRPFLTVFTKIRTSPPNTHPPTFPSYPALLFSACFSHLFNIYVFCTLSLSHLKCKFCSLVSRIPRAVGGTQ